MEEWRRLVTPGHVWVARLNAATWVGALVAFLFAASLVWVIYGNTTGLAKALAHVDDAPVTWWDRFFASPWDTVTGTAHEIGKQPRPVLNRDAVATIQPVPQGQISVNALTKPADLKGFINDNLKALNSTGKLSADYPACDQLDDLRKPWVNSKTGQPDVPRCLVSKSGDTIWLASLISNGNDYMPQVMPWLGVYHKDSEGRWNYYNVDGVVPAATARIGGYSSVTFDMIPYQIARDFPYLTKQGERHE
ncbi:hypothetical protein [Burkholderia vietnamiensis]|uniref:hypothetical protein n=1 Tax=Burkholderia vietnamiensis TaxID=60552 RepID=UPI0015942855|nr:hypothetical protein [Burkholderia vietnamiensis]